MLYLGTSGYSYDDWVGPFYPAGLKKGDFFGHYLQRFNAVELNFTHYRLPVARTLSRLADQAPPGFRFTLKAFGDMTLGRSRDPALYATYLEGITPLLEQGMLGCVLLQFPNSFHLSRENVTHLRFIRAQWPDLPLAVEFRHRSWVEDERTFGFLRELACGYCCVDEPQLSTLVPPVARFTAEPAYLRFHGRNAREWFQHEEAWQRYDYLYSPEELREWLPAVRELLGQARELYVFFNNHYSAKAAQNAQEFALLLEE